MSSRISHTIPNSSMSEVNPPRQKVSLLELVRTFNYIALSSFGGGLSAWSREVLVVDKHWMEEEEFLSAMTMCRILPGANQVNIAVFVGTKMAGIPGAFAAVFGLCFAPVLFMLGMGYLYFRFKEVPAVKSALHGASTAAVALTIAMVIKTGRKCLTGVVPVALFLATFVLTGLVRSPLPLTLAVLAPLGLVWAWPTKRAS